MVQVLVIGLAVLGALVLGVLWLWNALSDWLDWVPAPWRKDRRDRDARL